MRRLIGLLVMTSAAAGWGAKWDSGVAARAIQPFPQVDGRVYFVRFDSYRPATQMPNLNCVLVHGHGISQKVLDDVFERFDGGLLPNVNPELRNTINMAKQFLPPALGRSANRLLNLTSVSAFGYFYFGEYLIDNLLDTACARVWVPVQESNQTTTMEMTVRTEVFLRRFACSETPSQGQSGCAVLGHSKGGAVATAIVRRCAEAQQPTKAGQPWTSGGSELGAEACGNLGKVYSASGTIEGVGLPVILMASRKAEERKEEVKGLDKLTGGFFQATEAIEEGLRRIHRLEKLEGQFQIDILGDKTDDTNPAWYDLGPLALMDAMPGKTKPMPIGARHGKDFVLKKAGWLREIQYTAAGSAFRWDKFQYDSELDENGVKTYFVKPNQGPFITMGTLPEPAPALLGNGEFQKIFPRLGQRLRDGQGFRRALEFLREPFLTVQKKVDEILIEKLADFHGDPQAALAFVSGSAEVSKTPKMAAEMKRWGWIPVDSRPEQTISVQQSDGSVELGIALGACERGQKAPAAERIVVECKRWERLHHLGVTGMSIESADHIVSAFAR